VNDSSILAVEPASRSSLFGLPIDASSVLLTELHEVCSQQLTERHCAYVSGFPIAVEPFTTFLSLFGELHSNYGASDAAEAAALHPAINRVQCKRPGGAGRFVHERAGPLPAHSSRSWSHRRPALFAMLMIDSGWTTGPSGDNGESICVRWRDALTFLQNADPARFAEDHQLLTTTPLKFHANNVVESISHLPLLYPLADSTSPADWGVRLKVDLLDKLGALETEIPQFERYVQAVTRFVAAANDPSVRASYLMQAGDLVLIDNNRFGHGRLNVVPARESGGNIELNPRQLWSVSIGVTPL